MVPDMMFTTVDYNIDKIRATKLLFYNNNTQRLSRASSLIKWGFIITHMYDTNYM